MTSLGSVMRSGGLAVLAMAAATVATPASAVVLSEGNFASSTFVLSPTYSANFSDISVAQCSNCGVQSGEPGGAKALRFQTDKTAFGAVSLGVVLNNLSYDTSLGALSTITASAVKNVTLLNSVGPVGNFFRPLIEQGGSYYLASIPLGDFNTPTAPAGTGFVSGSATLSASNFTLYDFTTGLFGTANPNFASGILRFGIAQISTGDAPTASTVVYDNFGLTLTPTTIAVPEPATWAMMIGGFGLAAGTMRRRRATRTRVSFN